MLSLCACKPEEEAEVPEEPVDPNFPITLELNGETVTIHEAPDSVVSLSPAITELFFDLNEQSLLKGVSSYDSASKADCGTAQGVDLEAVKEISPDLLFTDTPLLNEELIQLQQMDVEVLYLPRPQSVSEITDRAELVLLALYGRRPAVKRLRSSVKTGRITGSLWRMPALPLRIRTKRTFSCWQIWIWQPPATAGRARCWRNWP